MRRPFSVSPLRGHLICFSLVLLGGAVSVISQEPALAAGGDPYAAGVKLLTAKQFPQAIQQFQAAVKANPKNAMAHYYLGLAKHYKGDRQGAMEAYSKVLSDFPGTDACNLAIRGMSSIDPTILQQLGLAPAARPTVSAGGSRSAGQTGQYGQGGGNSSLDYDRTTSDDILPDETRIGFTRDSNCMIMDGRIGGRQTKFMFDTGAEHVVIGKNQLSQLGVNLGPIYKTGTAYGSGSSGGSKTEIYKIDLQLGNIIRRNFPVVVYEHLDNYPIIGQMFFNDFQLTVDSRGGNVTFKRRGRGGNAVANAPLTANDVPFKLDGRELVVNVLVDGKSIPMYVDTGASWVTFTQGQAASIGIEVPADAPAEQSRGVSGISTTRFVKVRSFKLGPVEKRDFRIGVVDRAANAYPLLGAEFLGDQHYSIDYDRGVIHFGR